MVLDSKPYWTPNLPYSQPKPPIIQSDFRGNQSNFLFLARCGIFHFKSYQRDMELHKIPKKVQTILHFVYVKILSEI